MVFFKYIFLLPGLLLGIWACSHTDQTSHETAKTNKKESAEEPTPQALREGITVENFMDVESGCIRLNYDRISGDFYYNTMKGDIYQIHMAPDGAPSQKKVFTESDHGITSLQGFRLYDSLMFLAGNIDSNHDKGTKGKVVRGQLQPDGQYVFELLAITEDYGRTSTIYSHEFNGIAVDREGKYIYVNSGARTDHGELQDNEGAYPGAREVPLTACIFRLPADGKNILLKNDSAYLAENGYLFSDGVRNAYDLAISPAGHLFGVSNSSDYDHAEEMNWFREGHHYGYPWEMGNTQNPQQFADWDPDPEKDPFINPTSFAHNKKFFRNDPGFPKKPANLKITPPIQNYGPDANFYRDRETGEVRDGNETGVTVGTFTPHRSPLGLFFDKDNVLADEYQSDAFVLSWTNGDSSPLMRPFSPLGGDLMQMKLTYEPEIDNYSVRCYRIVKGFRGPTDAAMVDNVVYVIENRGRIWKVTLPAREAVL